MVPPARAFWPLVPRPAVLPLPAAMPRPTRVRGLWDPGAGLRSWSFTRQSPPPPHRSTGGMHPWCACASGITSRSGPGTGRRAPARGWRGCPEARRSRRSGAGPSARTVPRAWRVVLTTLLVSVTRSLPAIGRLGSLTGRLTGDVAAERLAAPRADLLGARAGCAAPRAWRAPRSPGWSSRATWRGCRGRPRPRRRRGRSRPR